MNSKRNASARLFFNIFIVFVLMICLGVTTYAVVKKSASSIGFFQTGKVKININDGNPVIKSGEFLFEPGMTVEKEFFVKNEGDCDVYFKIYFDHVDGDLAKIINIKVMDGDMVLFDGTPDDFTNFKTAISQNVLQQNESRDLKIVFNYPKDAGNSEQGGKLSFNLCAKAVQAKNNKDKEFD